MIICCRTTSPVGSRSDTVRIKVGKKGRTWGSETGDALRLRQAVVASDPHAAALGDAFPEVLRMATERLATMERVEESIALRAAGEADDCGEKVAAADSAQLDAWYRLDAVVRPVPTRHYRTLGKLFSSFFLFFAIFTCFHGNSAYLRPCYHALRQPVGAADRAMMHN